MNTVRNRPPLFPTFAFAVTLVTLTLVSKRGGQDFESGLSASPTSHATGAGTWNGLSAGQQIDGGKGMTALQAMLWKYVARCALPEGQELEAPPAPGQKKRLRFPGLFGLAPEWRDGTCDRACQEKVSSCLIALTNRTGKHVLVSILSGDTSMGKNVAPSENDLGFPHQEGSFFGNVFSSEAYACQGRGVQKGPQVKRFCALFPGSCSGLAQFVDVGPCETACQMSCVRLSDGSERCAARSCKDPQGRKWDHPLTTYLRNRIEAANADSATGLAIKDDGLDALDAGDRATFEAVDFGGPGQSVTSAAVDFMGRGHQGRIEVWVDDQVRIGAMDVAAAKAASGERRATIAVDAGSLSGAHRLTLKIVAGKDLGRMTALELR